MFGHEKGAFTGAHTRTIGKFEHANGGTLFLDEISALRSDLQAKLLRVLQEREIERIGSNKPIKVDIRVISATNTNLEDAVMRGEISPGPLLSTQCAFRSPSPRSGREGRIFPSWPNTSSTNSIRLSIRRSRDFPKKPSVRLTRYHWPGNIRELENLIERIVVLSVRQQTD